MELSFSDLRTKEVVNTVDGRRLGKVCDLVFLYPENKILGIVVPGGKGFSPWRNEQYIDMCHIVKIGDDVVLVNFNMPPKPTKKGNRCRSSQTCPTPCPPPCPPCPPNRPSGNNSYDGRRSYEEYE